MRPPRLLTGVLSAWLCHRWERWILKNAWCIERGRSFTLTEGTPAAGETQFLKLLLEPACLCLMFVRGFVDLSDTSSHNGLIREDSSLAETFRLIHKEVLGSIREDFDVLPALVSGTPPSGIKTRPEHMLNWDRSTPYQMLSSFFSVSSLLFSLPVGLAWGILFMRPGSCQQGGLADCRGAWNVKCYFWDSTEYKNEKVVSHTEQHTHAVDV